MTFRHAFDIQILNPNQIILADQGRAMLMTKATPLVGNMFVLPPQCFHGFLPTTTAFHST